MVLGLVINTAFIQLCWSSVGWSKVRLRRCSVKNQNQKYSKASNHNQTANNTWLCCFLWCFSFLSLLKFVQNGRRQRQRAERRQSVRDADFEDSSSSIQEEAMNVSWTSGREGCDCFWHIYRRTLEQTEAVTELNRVWVSRQLYSNKYVLMKAAQTTSVWGLKYLISNWIELTWRINDSHLVSECPGWCRPNRPSSSSLSTRSFILRGIIRTFNSSVDNVSWFLQRIWFGVKRGEK